jgi:hypothetical protein
MSIIDILFVSRWNGWGENYRRWPRFVVNVHLNIYRIYANVSIVGRANKVIDLRKLLAERFPHPAPAPVSVLPTGLQFLDQAIGGGFPQSAITELIAPKLSAGSASLIHALLLSAQRDRHFIALIDGSDSFDPGSSDNSTLQHLLWVRCRKALDAIKAADFLLRDGNFPLVIVDLVVNTADELRKIPQTSWYRLQRLVEAVPTACLVINRQSQVSSAQLKMVLDNSWTLTDLENQNAISSLQFRVQRSHAKSLLTGHLSQVTS